MDQNCRNDMRKHALEINLSFAEPTPLNRLELVKACRNRLVSFVLRRFLRFFEKGQAKWMDWLYQIARLRQLEYHQYS